MPDQESNRAPSGSVKVCILTETFYPVTGGGETQARAIASGLAASGVAVHVITRRSDKLLPRREFLGPVRLWRVRPTGPGQFKKWGLVITALIMLLRLRKSYDVILVCGFRILGIPALIAAFWLRKPCLLKADILGELSGESFRAGLESAGLNPGNFILERLIGLRNRLLKRASGYVSISTAVESEYLACGIAHGQISRIPNSVDTDRFCPADSFRKSCLRERFGLEDDAKVAIYTGRLETTKGLPTLMAAWKKIAERHRNAHLLIVGSGDLGINNCAPEVRGFVTQHALDRCVTFTGSVDNVHEYLQASDFFIFPSEREAFGISVIEALACALPVITTMEGGLSDIVTPERTAIVIPAGDAGALLLAIERAICGGVGLRKIASAGRELAVRRYSQAEVLGQYAAVLANLCEVGGASRPVL